MTPTCSRCEGPREGKDRYCRKCRAAYAREWRLRQKGKEFRESFPMAFLSMST